MRNVISMTTRVVILAGLGLLTACSSTGSGNVSIPSDDEWIDNPGLVEGSLAAVGSQIFVANEGAARTGAEADARAKLAAALKTEIDQLVENWAKEAGNLQIQDSLSSYINNEVFTRQNVETQIRGATAHAYRKRGNTLYCLMLMKTDEIAQWYDQMADTLEKEAMRDAALWQTEAMKDDARERLDKIKRERQEAHIRKVQALRGDVPSGSSEGDADSGS